MLFQHTVGLTVFWDRAYKALISYIMETIDEIVRDLLESGIRIWVEGNKLYCDAPVGVMNEELKSKISNNKDLLISYYSEENFRLKMVEPRDYYPVSSQQRRLYALQQIEGVGSGITYNTPGAYLLHKGVGINKIQKAVQCLIDRHEALRTRFEILDGSLIQKIKKSVDFEIEFESANLGDIDEIRRKFVHAFDLSRAPLLRMKILTGCDDIRVLLVDMHHIISDGTSVEILINDFFKALNGIDLEALQIQYKDYAVWQQEGAGRELLAKQRKYWMRTFEDGVPKLNLPTDFVRPRLQSFAGNRVSRLLSIENRQHIEDYCLNNSVSLNIFTNACYSVLLSRYSGQEDLIVGCETFGRDQPELEPIVGMFVNALAIRYYPARNKVFREYLQETRSVLFEAYCNQQYPFEELIEDLELDRDMSRNPMFDTAIGVQNFNKFQFESDDLVKKFQNSGTESLNSKFDLTVFIDQEGEDIRFTAEYCSELYKPGTVNRLLGHFERIILAAIERPETKLAEFKFIGAEEYKKLLHDFNNTETEHPRDKCIHELFEEQAERNPNEIAVILPSLSADTLKGYNGLQGGIKITYSELNRRANALAYDLVENHSVQADVLVGICVDRSIEMIVGILGILKAGGSYLPIDSSYPSERINYMLADAGVETLLVDGSGIHDLDYRGSRIDIRSIASIKNAENWTPKVIENSSLAYCIYTSGSTGRPKGVLINHESIFNTIVHQIELLKLGVGVTVLQFASICFDVSVLEIFATLCAGAKLCLRSDKKGFDPEILTGLIRDNKVNAILLPPLVLSKIDSSDLDCVKTLVVGGERCSEEIVKEWSDKCQLINEYGPTEASVCATVLKFNNSFESITIGGPIANTQVTILSSELNLQPIGVAGEICISGLGLARGYLNQSELTSEKFVEIDHANLDSSVIGRSFNSNHESNTLRSAKRVYRTGDCAKWNSNGNIEFIGRMDNQVKIRGYRIELGEIENVLRNIDGVANSLVIAHEVNGIREIVSYYTIKSSYQGSGAVIDESVFVEEMKKSLPDYMVPRCFIKIDKIPLSPNGKVDFKFLPLPAKYIGEGTDYAPPRNQIESEMAQIWSHVLGVKKIGIDDDFFRLGGHSFKAIEMVSRFRKELEIDIEVRDLFENPKIRNLSKIINTGGGDRITRVGAAGERLYYPTSSQQKRLYSLQEIDETGKAYNMPSSFILKGTHEVGKIKEAICRLIKKHEALRTYFGSVNGELVQYVGSSVDVIIEHSNVPESGIELEIKKFVRRFDLRKGPLFRAKILTIESGDHIVFTDIHHIVSDGVSMGVLLRDLMLFIEGVTASKECLSYKDYAVWQSEGLGKSQFERQRTYWLKRFEIIPPTLSLPTDFLRPAIRDFKGMAIRFELDEKTSSRLREVCKEIEITPAMLLLTCYKLLLSKISGSDDLVVGTVFSGRDIPDFEETVGLFVNTLPVRSSPSGSKTFLNYVCEIKELFLEAFSNQHCPLDELLQEIRYKYDKSRNSLFDVMFLMQNFESEFEETERIQYKKHFIDNAAAKCDLTLYARENESKVDFTFEYAESLFEKATISRFSEYFLQLVKELSFGVNKKVSEIQIFDDSKRFIEIVPVDSYEKDFLASFHQERLLFIDEFETESVYSYNPVYHNASLLIDVNFEIDLNRFDEVNQILVNRHTTLKTRFYFSEGSWYQRIQSGEESFIEVEECLNRSDAIDFGNKFSHLVLSPRCGALYRVGVFKYPPGSSILAIVAHHSIVDWYSLRLIAFELLSIYRSIVEERPLKLDKPVLQYVDFSEWQRSLISSGVDEGLSYWRKQLEGDELPILKYPTDRPRESVHVYSGKVLDFSIEKELVDKLMRLAKDCEVELSVVLFAVFNGLLMRHARQEEAIVGISSINRESDKLSSVVGPVSNLIPVRSRMTKEVSLSASIKEIGRTIENGLKYGYIPFDLIVSKVRPSKDMSRTALFDILFQYEADSPLDTLNGDSSFREIETNMGWGKYDLYLMIRLKNGELEGHLTYNEKYFNHERILNLIGSYKESLLGAQNKKIETLDSMLSIGNAEKEIIKNWSGIDSVIGDSREGSVQELFEAQCDLFPNKVALICLDSQVKEQTCTFKELDCRANRLARTLIKNEIGPGAIVGIYLDKSAELIVAMLAVLKAGGAYLPLDPSYPTERNSWICKDSEIALLLTCNALKNDFVFQGKRIEVDDVSVYDCNASRVQKSVKPSDPAYVIYTSGSTGVPKGVIIQHENLLQLFSACENCFSFSDQDVWTLFHSQSFDFSVWEIWGPLTTGAELVIIPYWLAREPEQFISVLIRYNVSILSQTPAALAQLTSALDDETFRQVTSCLRYIVLGGDRFQARDFKRWLSPSTLSTKLINMYGITETTIHLTFHEVTVSDLNLPTVSVVGKPLQGVLLYVMDDSKISSVGNVGGIYIAGKQLSMGYLNRPELTQERFLESKLLGEQTLYKTGDLGRWNFDGKLEYVGRDDDQIQLNGFRIELGEVESVLAEQMNVLQAVVGVREVDGLKSLVGYYVLDNFKNQKLDPRRTKGRSGKTDFGFEMRKVLPYYMVPNYFVEIQSIPLTVNGKVDRDKLPYPTEEMGSSAEYVSPNSKAELVIAKIWQDILCVEDIGVHDSYFDLGGDSIKAVQVISRLKEAGYKSTVRDLFEKETISRLVKTLKTLDGSTDTFPLRGEVNFSPIMIQFFESSAGINHFNQAVMLVRKGGFNETFLRGALEMLWKHHDALRLHLSADRRTLEYTSPEDAAIELHVIDLVGCTQVEKLIEEKCATIQSSFKIEKGPLITSALFKTDNEAHLLLVAHHLLVDGVSWRILLEDLELAYEGLLARSRVNLPQKSDDFGRWTRCLKEYANSESILREFNFWRILCNTQSLRIVEKESGKAGKMDNVSSVEFSLDYEMSSRLVKDSIRAYGCSVNELILSAVELMLSGWVGQGEIHISVEGHGREEIIPQTDVSRTVGWFTSIYPMVLNTKSVELRNRICSVKERVRSIPGGGIGYGILKHLAKLEDKDKKVLDIRPEVLYNYLGEFNSEVAGDKISISKYSVGRSIHQDIKFEYALAISCMTVDGKFRVTMNYDKTRFRKSFMMGLKDKLFGSLVGVIEHCCNETERVYTPSDYNAPWLSFDELEKLNGIIDDEIQSINQLTPTQLGMYFHHLKPEHEGEYILQALFKIKGEFDVVLCEKVVAELGKCHEVLRSRFVSGASNEPLQLFLEDPGELFKYIETTSINATETREASGWMLDDRNKGFRLDSESGIRFSVIGDGSDEYLFLVSIHHIVLDGWCLGILIGDFLNCYESMLKGKCCDFSGRTPYTSYLRWLNQKDNEEPKRYWKSLLSGFSEITKLPYRESNPRDVGFDLQEFHMTFDEVLCGDLITLCKRLKVTLNTVLQTLWALLLKRYNSTNDVLFGNVVSGRPGEIVGVEKIVGLFINTIPLRIKISNEQSFEAMLLAVQNQFLESQNNCHMSVVDFANYTNTDDDLFDHLFMFQNYPKKKLILDDKQVNAAPFSIDLLQAREQTSFDFVFNATESEQKLIVSIEYNRNRFSDENIKRVSGHFTQLMKSIGEKSIVLLRDLDILTPAERDVLIGDPVDESKFLDEKSIYELFNKQVERNPAAVAMQYKDNYLSYAVLGDKVSNLAFKLKVDHDVAPNVLVAICAERSFEAIIGILAVAKAGGAYLPIDVNQPRDRIDYILADSGVAVLLVSGLVTDRLSYEGSIIDLKKLEDFKLTRDNSLLGPTWGRGDGLAYCIYTSGSTGLPKGVLVENKSVVNLVRRNIECYGGEAKNYSQVVNFSFDSMVGEIWPCFAVGGCLHIAENYLLQSPGELHKWIERNKIDSLFLPTSLVEPFFETYETNRLSSLKSLRFGGEKITYKIPSNRNFRVTNEYGPTETTVWVSNWDVPGDDILPEKYSIGKPSDDTQMYIVDESMRLQPDGINGELLISGIGLARGYLNQAALTSNKFVDHPFTREKKVYRSGDLARRLPDGCIDFVGRIDDQVKIRGNRIELGEIECVLSGLYEVSEAVVVAREINESLSLVGYYVVSNRSEEVELGEDPLEVESEISSSELKRKMRKSLPDYMVPQYLVELQSIPLTRNGKVDRKALPLPKSKSDMKYVPPRNETDMKLVELWQELLGLSYIGIDDNFFDLGGHSLTTINLLSRVRKIWDVDLPIQELYKTPTIRALAEYIDTTLLLYDIVDDELDDFSKLEEI